MIVNGGKDPAQGSWLPYCVGKILAHTSRKRYRLYIWNNNTQDEFISAFLRYIPHATLVQASPHTKLTHVHADPLQRLYERARSDGARIFVTFDSDAHPVNDEWLDTLLDALDGGAVLAGVWRDELKQAIAPYVHASCLATTAEFIDNYGLRFDFIEPNSEGNLHDTLSSFTETAKKLNLPIHPLRRSNARNFHRLMGGIYGGLVYHHGAGSRAAISFWDEEITLESTTKNVRIGEIATHFLFTRYEDYMSWLSGNDVAPDFAAKLESLALGDTGAFSEIPTALAKKQKVGFNFESTKEFASKVIRRTKKSVDRVQLIKLSKQKCHPPELMRRPFTQEDYHSLPEGWKIGPPDFVGVGVPKAGTSWWYKAMLEHPQVSPHRLYHPKLFQATKELVYFCHFDWKGMSDDAVKNYRNAFAAPAESISGEWSTNYLLHPFALKMLWETAPNTKILLLLRNPVDRFVSHVNHLVKNRGKGFKLSDDCLSFFRKFSVMPEAYLHGQYAKGLTELLRLFPREQILVLQYESCCQNPMAEISRTFEFLGIDTNVRPTVLEKPVNRLEYIVDKPDNLGRKRLASLYAEEVRACTELLPELDLSLWSDFLQISDKPISRGFS
ncbi:sulfotransferase domain-containing protein [Halochromatium glycolicum]|uniref:sulfotransferase domain-containing protein n=1 Tax=Halochromatium glycolicum TaxID=85075 RepID=UPI00190993B1|nr:sulfotransferase domain-containing protein [Halochromatium glycolicum]